MFIRRAAVYFSLILSVIVTLLIVEDYLPPHIKMKIDTNLSLCKFKLLNLYDKFYHKEKEYEISVKLAKKELKDTHISRLIDYLPIQGDEFINYHENEYVENDEEICLINDSKATIQFTIKEKNKPLKKKIFKEKK